MYPQQVNLMCLISEEKLNSNLIFDVRIRQVKDKNPQIVEKERIKLNFIERHSDIPSNKL